MSFWRLASMGEVQIVELKEEDGWFENGRWGRRHSG